MYPLLILRCEIVCIIILSLLIITSKSYHLGRSSKTFYRLCMYGVFHVLFDIITVWTVNHLDTVPAGVNYAAHLVFYITAILFSHEILDYVVALCYPAKAKLIYIIGLALPAVYLCCLPFLSIEYVSANGTNSSSGTAAYVGYGIGFIYFIAATIILLKNTKKLSKPIRNTLLPVLLLLIVTETIQAFYKELLFTGGAITIVTIAFFFTLESPVKIFERKVLTDTLTGVRSRHSYDQNIAEYDEEFRANPSDKYIFAFCDINNLRAVNARFGHAEGDHYISFISSIMTRELVHAEGIYRMGGDEFLVIYIGVPEETVSEELAKVHAAAELESMDMDYDPSVSIGYAVSSGEYSSLRDVLRTADYIMYRNKAEMKGQKAFLKGIRGTRLNLSGLTDRIFDAMSSSNNRSYPFITNMDTGVTRISDYWKDFFELPDVFFAGFIDIWKRYIHPEEREDFELAFNDVYSGKEQYLDTEFRALAPNGDYVACTCRGSVYHGKDGEPDVFAGYMVNHGVADTVDPITGLNNLKVIARKIEDSKQHGKTVTVLKLRIKNYSRVNLLYGYEAGEELHRSIAARLCEIIGNHGEVYCQDGSNYSILFRGDDKPLVKVMARRISEAFGGGLRFNGSALPLEISSSAMVIRPDNGLVEKEQRSALIAALEESGNFRHGELVFVDELQNKDSADIRLLADIHSDALGDKEHFFMRYQPIHASYTGEVMGAEALIRWESPEYGEVRPDRFIAFLENDTCYYDLGFFILRRALEDALVFKKNNPYFKVNINITALQLQHDDFLPRVLEMLRELNYPSSDLVLELTERCKELDEDFLKERIMALRQSGIRVALDDMGTGYSTISLLVNIPMDEIKLDMNFTQKLLTSREHQIIADALCKGVKNASVDLCFEGVESAELLDFVKGYGPFLCQGYYFSKPLKAEEFNTYMRK